MAETSLSDGPERIVYDPKIKTLFVRLEHSSVHGSREHLRRLAALLMRADYEVGKGMHEAPPLPRSTWAPGEIKDIADG